MEGARNNFQPAALRSGQESAFVHAKAEIERAVQRQNRAGIEGEPRSELLAEDFAQALRTAAHEKTWRDQRLGLFRCVYELKKCPADPIESGLGQFVHRCRKEMIRKRVPTARLDGGAGNDEARGLFRVARAEFHGDITAKRNSNDQGASVARVTIDDLSDDVYGSIQAKWNVAERPVSRQVKRDQAIGVGEAPHLRLPHLARHAHSVKKNNCRSAGRSGDVVGARVWHARKILTWAWKTGETKRKTARVKRLAPRR